jgi:hypothetical protein
MKMKRRKLTFKVFIVDKKRKEVLPLSLFQVFLKGSSEMVITANMPVSSVVNVWPETKVIFKSYSISQLVIWNRTHSDFVCFDPWSPWCCSPLSVYGEY